MRINKCMNTWRTGRLFALMACVAAGAGLLTAEADSPPVSATAATFTVFQQALEDSDDTAARAAGDSIFAQVEKKYAADAGFVALKSKLAAAEFLSREMISQLKSATSRKMQTVADELLGKKPAQSNDRIFAVAPARSFYETSIRVFSVPITIAGLTDEERQFVARYYELRLRILVSSIAQAGQALAIAEPRFTATSDYVLVLPLLHASDSSPVNINVLPRWMQQPEQIGRFADSCLLHFGVPFQAMMIARQCAERQKRDFSEFEFYRAAARRCKDSHPHIAVDCLLKALKSVPDNDAQISIAVQVEAVQVWLDSGNYHLAAGQARKIFESYPDHEESGKAIWLYHYALSRGNNTDEILGHIDKALADKHCEPYKANLMYVKWWALRRRRDQTAQVAVLEHELLRQYGHDAIVAPVLLSRATDLLARQDYNGAYQYLTQLAEKFPDTKAAEQAKEMLEKLKASIGSK